MLSGGREVGLVLAIEYGQVVSVQYGIETEGTNTSNLSGDHRKETKRLRAPSLRQCLRSGGARSQSGRLESEQRPVAEEERVEERVVDGLLAIGAPRHGGEHNWMLRRRRRDFG